MALVNVSLSIKEVPEEVARLLRRQAERNHRSLQGELLHILETAVRPRPFKAEALAARIRALGLQTPAESVTIVRKDRDRP